MSDSYFEKCKKSDSEEADRALALVGKIRNFMISDLGIKNLMEQASFTFESYDESINAPVPLTKRTITYNITEIVE